MHTKIPNANRELCSPKVFEWVVLEANNAVTIDRTQIDNKLLETCVILCMGKFFKSLMAKNLHTCYVDFSSLNE